MKVNGQEHDAAGMELRDFLRAQGYKENRIAVEYNGNILSKKDWDGIMLSDADRLEIVTFVGGG